MSGPRPATDAPPHPGCHRGADARPCQVRPATRRRSEYPQHRNQVSPRKPFSSSAGPCPRSASPPAHPRGTTPRGRQGRPGTPLPRARLGCLVRTCGRRERRDASGIHLIGRPPASLTCKPGEGRGRRAHAAEPPHRLGLPAPAPGRRCAAESPPLSPTGRRGNRAPGRRAAANRAETNHARGPWPVRHNSPPSRRAAARARSRGSASSGTASRW